MCPNRLMVLVVRKCKTAFHAIGVKHFVLLFFYLWYLIMGAVTFYALEYDNVNYLNMLWEMTLNTERVTFVRTDLMPSIFNNSVYLQFINDQRTRGITAVIERQLIDYERRLGVEFRLAGPLKRWEFEHALVYACSLCTTIGYGFVHPLTTGGRIASVVYSLFGIPFTMVLVRDWSRLVAKLLNYPGTVVLRVWDAFRYCTLKSVESVDELRALRERDRILLNDVVLNIPTSVAAFALMGWVVAGAFAFCSREPAWTMIESFLFCFNSLTTVGEMGGTVPREPRFLLAMMIYVYAGLAIVSLFVDLIYAKLLLAYKPAPFVFARGAPRPVAISPTSPVSLAPTRSSFDNDSVDRGVDRDVDLGSCVTLGIMRMDGRAHKYDSLLRRDRRTIDDQHQQQPGVNRSAQTRVSVPKRGPVQLAAVSEDGGYSYQHLIIPSADDTAADEHKSSDDVTTLLVETYGSARRNLRRQL